MSKDSNMIKIGAAINTKIMTGFFVELTPKTIA